MSSGLEEQLLKTIDLLNFEHFQEEWIQDLDKRFLKYLQNILHECHKRCKKTYYPNKDSHSLLLSPAFSAILRNIESRKYPESECQEVINEYTLWKEIPKEEAPSEYVSPCGSFMINSGGQKIENSSIDRIILDFDFPLVWDHVDITNKRFECLSKNNQVLSTKKISRSLKYLREKSPEAYKLVRSQTKIIHVRQSSNEFSASSSNVLRNGATVVRGIECDDIGLEVLAEFLVHEAIHHLIYKIEILHEEFVDQNNNQRPTAVGFQSPWSGNVIALDAFTHAIFVWFGIYKLWTKFDRNSHVELTRRYQAARGFLSPTRLSEIFYLMGVNFKPEILSSIDIVQKSVSLEIQNQFGLDI